MGAGCSSLFARASRHLDPRMQGEQEKACLAKTAGKGAMQAASSYSIGIYGHFERRIQTGKEGGEGKIFSSPSGVWLYIHGLYMLS